MKKQYPIYIQWLDSKGMSGDWEFIGDIQDMDVAVCETLGYKISENDRSITIAGTISGEQIMGRLSIPKCAIITLSDILETSINRLKGVE